MAHKKLWNKASTPPPMELRDGTKLGHLPLVMLCVCNKCGRYRFEQWGYTPSLDGPWNSFVEDRGVRLWAIAGFLFDNAREEAGI